MSTVDEALSTALEHLRAGRLPEAAAVCEAILKVAPDNARALASLGLVALISEQAETAVALIGKAVRLAPGEPTSQNNLGDALRRLGRCEDAVAHFRAAIALRPDFHEAHANIATALQNLGRTEEALWHMRAAAAIDGRNADYRLAMGRLKVALGDVDDALAEVRDAIEMRPEDTYSRCLLANMLLSRGRFREGWLQFEWRLRHQPALRRRMEALVAIAPRWEGGPVAGKTVLLASEQGLGDTILFARYAPVVAAAGARVIVQCQGKLKPLLAGLPGVAEVLAEDDPIPPVDLQASLPSLPFLLSGQLGEAIPQSVPYLCVDEARVATWRRRIGAAGGLRIGISWQGNPGYGKDASRSIPLGRFLPLAGLSGVRLFSLQGEHGLEELRDLPVGSGIETLGSEIEGGPEGLLNTAAAILALDLIVSGDSAITHLAGALGKPVWLLVSDEPLWFWQRDREDSPWYPGVRIFRWTGDDDWDGVFRRLEAALAGTVRLWQKGAGSTCLSPGGYS